MYRLTNLTLDTTTTYKNKDLVFQALERENAKVKYQEAESLLLVEELDKKNIIIYQEEIYLPFEGIAESLFLKMEVATNPETLRKDKPRSFLKSSKSAVELKEESVSNKSLSDLEPAVGLPSPKRSALGILWRSLVVVGLIASLSVAGVSIGLVLKQEKTISTLTQKVSELDELQTETGKVDVFVRYFLPHFYSEQANVEDFVEDNLHLSNQAGQLQSVILESSSLIGEKTYQMTYVLAVKEGDNRSQKRLTMTVKESSSAPYGYQVVSEPELVAYPK